MIMRQEVEKIGDSTSISYRVRWLCIWGLFIMYRSVLRKKERCEFLEAAQHLPEKSLKVLEAEMQQIEEPLCGLNATILRFIKA